MRLALLLPVMLCVAAPAYAEGARESRYGPTTPRQASAAAVAASYDGPMLGWANKRQASTNAVAPAASAPAQPAPMAPWAGYSAPATIPARTPPAPAPALPASLYAAPRPSPTATAATAPAPVKDWSNYRSTRVSGVAPPPAPPPAPIQATPTPPPRQVAVANTGAVGGHFYSVSRESGLTPDPIPPAGPDRQVLITAEAPQPPPEDAVPLHGSADWLAAGVRGDDDSDDDSATRRAKARKQDQ
jgi:hypothetical protein